MHRWLYVSLCRLPAPWQENAVTDIVTTSRARNAALGVTGALLFTGQRFAQYLEGAETELARLRASIERDARHAEIRTILDGHRPERLFDDWTLAYAGPSRFVSGQVEAALDDAGSADTLIQVLREFATPS
ncbi:BLUF domain-containing protein [Sphingomonas sp. CGMCC 1.13654]|uniref:BLUF domain-containing protein n=1 Tax=Sphingomonas chungangi TaxID=2683589 RepID=A0A838LBF6_9SPHN|nr:BLUF domain-containing protein [Sphingomonas chungangi]MVW54610.1 blue light sensor protein [Sphingomonas chungangi]